MATGTGTSRRHREKDRRGKREGGREGGRCLVIYILERITPGEIWAEGRPATSISPVTSLDRCAKFPDGTGWSCWS